jgi:hypothetical protein
MGPSLRKQASGPGTREDAREEKLAPADPGVSRQGGAPSRPAPGPGRGGMGFRNGGSSGVHVRHPLVTPPASPGGWLWNALRRRMRHAPRQGELSRRNGDLGLLDEQRDARYAENTKKAVNLASFQVFAVST